MEILSPDAALPIPYLRRLNPIAEQTRYIARPGLRALPSGTLTLAGFAGLQTWTLIVLLWAIWWPAPRSTGDWSFAVGTSAILLFLVAAVLAMLLRRHPGFLLGVARAPFIRLTVTDRRILWTLPWARTPLLEIGHERVLGGILGSVDRRGSGNAAVMLVPGDPAADVDGHIHFDRLPHAARFVNALGAA